MNKSISTALKNTACTVGAWLSFLYMPVLFQALMIAFSILLTIALVAVAISLFATDEEQRDLFNEIINQAKWEILVDWLNRLSGIALLVVAEMTGLLALYLVYLGLLSVRCRIYQEKLQKQNNRQIAD